jgi:SAM-dependent methyltransferase
MLLKFNSKLHKGTMMEGLLSQSLDETVMASLMHIRNKRTTGQVATGKKVAELLVDQIPLCDIKDPTKRYLDPCCGSGGILYQLIKRLSKYHTPEQINKMVVGTDSDPQMVATAQVSINGTFDIQLICCDSLRYNWDMKFDYVIMNPPFNDDSSSRTSVESGSNHRNAGKLLHVDFINFALDIAKEVIVICPTQNWFFGKGGKTKTRIVEDQRLRMFNKIPMKDAEKMFKAKTGDLGIFYFGADKCSTVVCYVNNSKVIDQEITDDFLVANSGDHYNILNKMLTASKQDCVGELLEVSKGPKRSACAQYYTPVGKYKLVESVGALNTPLNIVTASGEVVDPTSGAYIFSTKKYSLENGIGSYRVGINQGGTPHKLPTLKVIPPNVVTTYSINTFPCQSEQHANNLITYLQTKLITFVIKQTHTGRSNSKQTFKYVPQVDLSRSWTDAELYKHFKLTKAEIKLIEDTVK